MPRICPLLFNSGFLQIGAFLQWRLVIANALTQIHTCRNFWSLSNLKICRKSSIFGPVLIRWAKTTWRLVFFKLIFSTTLLCISVYCFLQRVRTACLWLCHVMWMDHWCMPQQALYREIPGFRRGPGRPKTNWTGAVICSSSPAQMLYCNCCPTVLLWHS